MNLVVNARDAMPHGGTLTIETANVELDEARAKAIGAAPGPFVRVAVVDTGTGIEDGVLARIFDPFFTTKAAGRGTGLGLSTVYGIVKQSGGVIQVATRRGEGTRFEVYLPRADVGTARGAEKESLPDLHGRETVLVVEDQEPLLMLVAEVLREFGYRVLAARHGSEALKVAKNHRGLIELVLTDVVLPRMRGPELVERLEEERPDLRALYMSGFVADSTPLRAPHDGRMPIIAKPFTTEALARKVRQVLDERAAP
jgi:CheY-like chemotaxis protein